jgi:hypothetical protein
MKKFFVDVEKDHDVCFIVSRLNNIDKWMMMMVLYSERGGMLPPQSKKDLVTRSATVRFTDGATAYDVVQLLGENLELLDPSNYGVLILVGILYNMPAVDFDHEDDQDGFHNLTNHLLSRILISERTLKWRVAVWRTVRVLEIERN